MLSPLLLLLRQRANIFRKGGKLEIHVPRRYTAERPAFRFAHETFDCRISDHPLGGQLPETDPDARVSVSPPLADAQQLGLAPGFPRTMNDMIDRDAPQLSFKIITFSDATLVAPSFAHTTWDGPGVVAFMKALECVVQGRDEQVPPMLGAYLDIAAEKAGQCKDRHKADKILEKMAQRTTAQVAPNSQPLETRLIRLPMSTIDRLRMRLQEEDADGKYFAFSNEQLLMAWAVQQVAKAEPSPRPMELINCVNARALIPSLSGAGGLFTQNLVLLANKTLTAGAATGSVSTIAAGQLENIIELASPQHLEQYLYTFVKAVQEGLDSAWLSGESGAMPLLLNTINRVSGSYEVNIDFSSVVSRKGRDAASRTNALGSMDCCFLSLLGEPRLSSFVVIGTFTENVCWATGDLPGPTWNSIEQYLNNL